MTKVVSTMTPEEVAAWERDPVSLYVSSARAMRMLIVYDPGDPPGFVMRVCPACGTTWEWTDRLRWQFDRNTRAGSDPNREPCCSLACALQERDLRKRDAAALEATAS